MKNAILIFIMLVSYSICSNAIQYKRNVMDLVKTTDKSSLLNILTMIQDEQIKLNSNKENHMIYCEKSLHSCKLKFSNKMCDISNEAEERELDEKLKENEEIRSDSSEMLKKIGLLIKQNEQDCKEIDDVFKTNNDKFESDTELINKILDSMRIRLNVLHEQEEKRIQEERRKHEEKLELERKKAEEAYKQVKLTEDSIKKKKEEVGKMMEKMDSKIEENQALQKQIIKLTKIFEEKVSNSGRNQTNQTNKNSNLTDSNDEKEEGKDEGKNSEKAKKEEEKPEKEEKKSEKENDKKPEKEEKKAQKDEKSSKSGKNDIVQVQLNSEPINIGNSHPHSNSDSDSKESSKPKSKPALNSFFLQKIRQAQEETRLKEDPSKKTGFFGSLFTNMAQITGGFSFVQLMSESQIQTGSLSAAIDKIDKKLSQINSYKEQVDYLVVSQKELNMVLDNLRHAKLDLYNIHQDSKKQCEDRLEEFKSKKDELRKSFMNSKLEVENIHKKMQLIDSQKKLCSVSRQNLMTCNEISDYCQNYQIEYSQEIKELEDLLLYFRKYINRF